MRNAAAAFLLGLSLSALALPGAGLAQEAGERLPKVLEPGDYRAAVGGVLCDACLRAVLRELRGLDGLVEARFDANDRYRLYFSVRKGTTLRLSQLQRAMRSASRLVNLDTELLLTEIRPDLGKKPGSR